MATASPSESVSSPRNIRGGTTTTPSPSWRRKVFLYGALGGTAAWALLSNLRFSADRVLLQPSDGDAPWFEQPERQAAGLPLGEDEIDEPKERLYDSLKDDDDDGMGSEDETSEPSMPGDEPVISGATTTTSTSTTTNTPDIRSWGCARTETPLVFVHIGKAGGGMIRARFAASAEDYDRDKWYDPSADSHYYPIDRPTGISNANSMKDKRGRWIQQEDGEAWSHSVVASTTAPLSVNASFCNSGFNDWKAPSSSVWGKAFEGNQPCPATTPMGGALACPDPKPERNRCLGCKDLMGAACHTVYVGHNSLGAELHWLPPRFLEEWWSNTKWGGAALSDDDLEAEESAISDHTSTNVFRPHWKILYPMDSPLHPWCASKDPKRVGRPNKPLKFANLTDNCTIPLARQWDERFDAFWAAQPGSQSSRTRTTPAFRAIQATYLRDHHNDTHPDPIASRPNHHHHDDHLPFKNYSPIYASLPVHRVTLVREPWSWILSKFQWHKVYKKHLCDDLDQASRASLADPGWAYAFALSYIVQLCGDDCAIRLETTGISYEELYAQAADNLRHAFSVVGLLNETDVFYGMVSTRIAYADLSKNSHVTGKPHRTGKSARHLKCEETFFRNETFRDHFRERLPIFRMLEDLYDVAVEVYEAQRAELESCPDSAVHAFGEVAAKDAAVWKEGVRWKNQDKIDRMRQQLRNHTGNTTNKKQKGVDPEEEEDGVNATELLRAVNWTAVVGFLGGTEEGANTTIPNFEEVDR